MQNEIHKIKFNKLVEQVLVIDEVRNCDELVSYDVYQNGVFLASFRYRDQAVKVCEQIKNDEVFKEQKSIPNL